MTKSAEARAADAVDDPIRASDLYEQALLGDDADRDMYVDLAVLYFVCCDDGYSAAHRLDREFLDRAWRRARQLLDEAQLKFGRDDEIDFWRGYFAFVDLGEPAQDEKWNVLAASGSTLVPLISVFSRSPERFERDARRLLESVRDGATARKRYVESVSVLLAQCRTRKRNATVGSRANREGDGSWQSSRSGGGATPP
jgi:hypothetical protein